APLHVHGGHLHRPVRPRARTGWGGATHGCDPAARHERQAGHRRQLRPDEVMLDLGSPETMIQALRLSLRYASGGEDAIAENAVPRWTAGGPADRDSQDRMLAHNVSLPLLLPVMIQVPTHKGPA